MRRMNNQRSPGFQQSARALITLGSFSALLVICCIVAGYAQSGRRVAKPAPTPTPEESPEPKPSPKKTSTDKPQVVLLLGMDGNSFNNIPLYYYDAVLQSCADRLNEAPSVAVDVSGTQMNRTEAIRIAKSQKEGYVAELQLRTDNMSGSANSNQDRDIFVEYWVFAPGTAKVVASGRAYQRLGKTGSVISRLPTGRTSTVYTEQLLRQAGQDAADRILDALHVVRQKAAS